MTNDCSKYAPMVVRLGLTFVFMWFGLTQVLGPDPWTSLIPAWITELTGISAVTFVLMNGIFEIVAAILLAFGLWNRIVATLLFLHMVTIIIDIGFNSIGIRDTGLALAALSVALYGQDVLSISFARRTFTS